MSFSHNAEFLFFKFAMKKAWFFLLKSIPKRKIGTETISWVVDGHKSVGPRINQLQRYQACWIVSVVLILGCLILTWWNVQEFIYMAKIGLISQCTFLLARYDSTDLSTFLCLPNNTICKKLQNTLLNPIQLLRPTQNAYHTAISWGLGTDNSRWGPGLVNTMDPEAIRNLIHAFSPVQCSMCEMVHCHHETFFFFFKCDRFFQILSTNWSKNAV